MGRIAAHGFITKFYLATVLTIPTIIKQKEQNYAKDT